MIIIIIIIIIIRVGSCHWEKPLFFCCWKLDEIEGKEKAKYKINKYGSTINIVVVVLQWMRQREIMSHEFNDFK